MRNHTLSFMTTGRYRARYVPRHFKPETERNRSQEEARRRRQRDTRMAGR